MADGSCNHEGTNNIITKLWDRVGKILYFIDFSFDASRSVINYVEKVFSSSETSKDVVFCS